jgi:hypothetical protein
MSTVDNRNAKAKSYVNMQLNKAKKFAAKPPFFAKYLNEDNILTNLIPVQAKGFRGIVLTAIVGMHLDDTFNPTLNFYDCNPRSIFEKAIFYALTEHKIPCGKSDPLNVAKNVQQLDLAWAKGKRPESAAIATVEYINLLWKNKKSEKYNDLVELFFYRLLKYGEFVETQNVTINFVKPTFSGAIIASKLGKFVIDCAEGGALTQFTVGLLISKFRQNNKNFDRLEGLNDSVFGTNTTSKKPADVWEIMHDGSLGKLYEISVKTIDKKRLEDCLDSLKKLNILDKEIIFIWSL